MASTFSVLSFEYNELSSYLAPPSLFLDRLSELYTKRNRSILQVTFGQYAGKDLISRPHRCLSYTLGTKPEETVCVQDAAAPGRQMGMRRGAWGIGRECSETSEYEKLR